MSEESTGSVSGSILGQSFSVNGIKRIAELISILSLVVMAVLSYGFYVHTADAKDDAKAIQDSLKEDRAQRAVANEKLLQAIQEQSRATKLQTCILSVPEAQRQQQFDNPNSLCNRLAR